MNPSLLIVGNPDPVHLGHHLLTASRALGIPSQILDLSRAQSRNRWINRLFWHLLDHRPAHVSSFNRNLLRLTAEFKPTHVITTGIAPVMEKTLLKLAERGITTQNFLTDDPWNASHKSRWFPNALRAYSCVFTPRKANLGDLRSLGCPEVEQLPFGYSESNHFIAPNPPDGTTHAIPPGDIFFAGGADADRIGYIRALINAGIRPILFGNYWSQYHWARPFYHGFISIETQRHLVSRVPLCLVLVRRANRDGHSMRTYEIPAMGGCIVTEDTADHRDLFGPPGASTFYFSTESKLVTETRRMLAEPASRARMASESTRRITSGGHRYSDRLNAMLFKPLSMSRQT